MAPVTLFPDLATGLAATLADALKGRNVDDLSAAEVSAAIFTCSFLRNLVSIARRSIEATLCEGVDAKAFAANSERAIAELDRVRVVAERVAERARTGHLPVLAQEFVTNFQGLERDLTDLRRFLLEAVARAKAPLGPIDLKRLQEAQAAYDRGATRPFRQKSESHQTG
jgi:hypothetical protein